MDEKQFETLLKRLDDIENRLARVEQERQSTLVVTPPPVKPAPNPTAAAVKDRLIGGTFTPVPQSRPTPQTRQLSYSPAAIPPAKDHQEPETDSNAFEYLVGARGLPLVGAGLTILAIIYFTTTAFTRGWITSEMIYGGAITLCLGFIGVGQFLRDEREQFGQILTGVGSCGLYITFAAGHFAQSLYSGTVMLGLFVCLSLLNLGYGYWKASTAFLTIGVIGGFIASFLPLTQPNPQIQTHLLLHALIVFPATLIIARHKWLTAAVIFLPVAIIVNAAALWMPGDEWLKIASLSTTALLGTYAYARSYRESTFDPTAAFLPIALAGIAWINFEIRDSYPGSLHIIAFGLALAALSRLNFPEEAVKRIHFAALTIPLILAPWGATKVETTFLLSALAIGLAWLGTTQKNKLLQGLSAIEASLGVAAYIVATIQGKITSYQLEIGILVALIIAGLVSLRTIYNAFDTKEQNLAIGGLTLSLLSLRLLTLSLTQTPAALQPVTAFLLSFAVIASILHFAGFRLNSYILQAIAYMGSGALLCNYVFVATPAEGIQYGEHMFLGGVVLAHAFFLFQLYYTDSNETRNSAAIAILVPASGVVAELVYATLTSQMVRAVPDTGWVWALVTATTILTYAAHRLDIADLKVISLVGLGGTYTVFAWTRLYDPTHILWAESTLLLALAAVTLYTVKLNWPADSKQQNIVAGYASAPLAAIAIWLLQIQQVQGFNFPIDRSITISGLIATATLCAIAYRKQWMSLIAPAWLSWLLAAFPLVVISQQTPFALILLLTSQIALAIIPDKSLPETAAHRYFHLFITTLLVSRLGMLTLQINSPTPDSSPALTATWTALAVVFLIAGFTARITEIRHAGLGLLILTAGKLVLVDLASTDEIVRVAVTLALGLAMIGGGYLYIRLQNQLSPPPPKTVPTD